MASLLHLFILSLATWRLGSMLASQESGPFGLLHTVRELAGVTYDENSELAAEPGSLADGLICIKCNTIWLGLAFSLLYWLSPRLATALAFPFALSGAGLLINKL